MKPIFYYLFAIVISIGGLQTLHAHDLVLTWNASPSSVVAGYNVYYGTNSGNYTYKVQAGNATEVVISNLLPGVTYYFAATAYDLNGDESAYSSEIIFIVPGVLAMNQPIAGAPASLQFPVEPGHWYEVQATSDLQNWSSVWQTSTMTSNLWVQFTDPNAGAYASRFYRLVLH